MISLLGLTAFVAPSAQPTTELSSKPSTLLTVQTLPATTAPLPPPETTTTTTPPTTTTTAAPQRTTTTRPARSYHRPAPAPTSTTVSEEEVSPDTTSATDGGFTSYEASWYGPGLYGNGTACGQRYTETIVGVAHKSLACGTMVTFRYKGVIVEAPVIDRGPYVPGRTWDLSHGLCQKLNHCFTGPLEARY